MGPPKTQDPRRPNNNNKNNNNKSNNRNNDRQSDDRNSERGNKPSGSHASSNYKGKSKLHLTATHVKNLDESRSTPTMQMLISTVLPENIDDYLQVHISLPQTRSQTSGPTIATTVTPTVATATPAAKTTRATRKKRKTSPTATEISPTATETPMPAPPHPRRPQSTLQSEGIDALSQIDTRCQVGNVINRRVLRDRANPTCAQQTLPYGCAEV